ncbi:MAG TPA: tRNA (guanosine(46)-N7)-methyltransferase TrmB [Desulfobacteraceae bacterium]|nr:tRNA (guanosine(46)-N7)-methyltransferase TrmB [Desulfobacteraceae bacterium]|tara:strand:+ start:976 stop:1638 length:663 start_codon:yes stop_codon:yes gene_type:complete
MPKTKNIKYQRVRTLPNVIIRETDEAPGGCPWQSFADNRRTILELGCGKGEHSIGFASAFPDALCIGVDLKSHRLCSGGQRGLELGLTNLFFLRARVERIMDFFREGSVSDIWLTFPDPHPKQRGIKHRLTSPGFLEIYTRLLSPGGTVHLKTDSLLLYTYTRDMVDVWGGNILVSTRDLHGGNPTGKGARDIVSAFEAKALKRGDTIKYISFTLNQEAP